METKTRKLCIKKRTMLTIKLTMLTSSHRIFLVGLQRHNCVCLVFEGQLCLFMLTINREIK